MQVGRLETIKEIEKKRRAGSRITTGGPGGPGNGSGGDGADGEGPEHKDLPVMDDTESVEPDKSKYIAWFLLIAVGMTFAGLLGAYFMLAMNRAAEWKPFDLPPQVWVSTAIILLSSISYALAKRGVDINSRPAVRRWFCVTTVLGAAFISSQLILWLELVNRGLYLRGNPYAGFFYILTAAHLVHVLGGIIALGAILLSSWYSPRSDAEFTRRRQLARSVGWYWHFMGVLWVVLFLMLGFWK